MSLNRTTATGCISDYENLMQHAGAVVQKNRAVGSSPTAHAQSWKLAAQEFFLAYLPGLASFPMRVNSGRYIEMTMPPIVTPRKAIRTGSIIESRSAMAESTSSS